MTVVAERVVCEREAVVRPTNALHPAPPRNALGQATTSGCTSRGARFRYHLGGGVGKLRKRCATRSRFRRCPPRREDHPYRRVKLGV
jgi:hypothetical protein